MTKQTKDLTTMKDSSIVQSNTSPIEEILAISFPKFGEIVERKTPKEWLMALPGKTDDSGKPVIYVQVGYVRRLVDEAFGPAAYDWETEAVTTPQEILALKSIVVKGRLTIRDPFTGRVLAVRESYGGVSIKTYKKDHPTRGGEPLDLGNDYKSADADAFKKCAAKLGFCQDIYEMKVEAREDAIEAEAVKAEANAQAAAADPKTDTGKVAWFENVMGRLKDKDLGRVITQDERNALWGYARRLGFDEAGFRTIIKESTKTESTKDMLVSHYQIVAEKLMERSK